MAIDGRDFTDAQIRGAMRIVAQEVLGRGESELRLTLHDREYRMLRLQLLELHRLGWREIGRNSEFVALRFVGTDSEPEQSAASPD